MIRVALASLLLAAPLLIGCGSGGAAPEGDAGALPTGCDPFAPPSRFASCVLSFEPGPGAGYGQKEYPEIVYGPPQGGGLYQGSTDVLSLGKGGRIAVGFGMNAIVDGPGVDFLVFENPFFTGGTGPDGGPDGGAPEIFAELGEVSVSDDGETWTTFPCHSDAYPYTGCAGWNPVIADAKKNDISPFDPQQAGGDPFDLADVGLTHARFVRIHDISNYGGAPDAGFDLDAVAVVNAAIP
jgi:hypothetical protein